MIADYLSWHYGIALGDTMRRSTVLLRAVANYFSILPLAQTLFAPWHRVVEPYQRGFAFSAFLWTLVANLVSRMLGAIVRLAVIFAGLAAVLLTAALRLVSVAVWILLPLAVPAAILFGIAFLMIPSA